MAKVDGSVDVEQVQKLPVCHPGDERIHFQTGQMVLNFIYIFIVDCRVQTRQSAISIVSLPHCTLFLIHDGRM
jgi:hypothetical protein